MLRRVRASTIVLAAVALAVLGGMSFLYTHVLWIQSAVVKKAEGAIGDELSRFLGREVELGAVASGGLNSIVLTDLVVPARPGEGDDPVLEVSRVTVDYSLLDVVLRRRPFAETISSVVLEQPVLRAGLGADGRMWPREVFGFGIGRDEEGRVRVGGFSASVTVRDGRIELSGVPGFGDVPLLRSIEAKATVAGTSVAGVVNARVGPGEGLSVTATGRYDGTQPEFSCDATLSGALPGGLLDGVRRLGADAPGLVAAMAGARAAEWLDRCVAALEGVGSADVSGGRMSIEAHAHSDAGGAVVVRGSASLEGASLTASDVFERVTHASGEVKLAADFQASANGLTFLGKGSVELASARLNARAVGLGELDAAGAATVELRVRPGEPLSFAGTSRLEAPDVDAGAAIAQALGLKADLSGLRVNGPVRVDADFEGRAGEGASVRGTVSMARGRWVADGVLPEVAKASGDLRCKVEFSLPPGGVLSYSGKLVSEKASVEAGAAGVGAGFAGDVGLVVRFAGSGSKLETYQGSLEVLGGRASVAYPDAGISSLAGAVSGSAEITGGASEPAKYSGSVRLEGARAEASSGPVSVDGVADALVDFSGSYPGRARVEGAARVSHATVRVDEGPGGLERLDVAARGEVSFGGELPGAMTFSSSWTVPGGTVQVAGGPLGDGSLASSVAGSARVSGSVPGRLDYSGRVVLHSGAIELGEGLVAGLSSLKGSLEGSVEFEGLGGEFSYRGVASLTDGALEAGEIAPGVKRLAGAASCALSFRGASGGDPEFEGKVVIAGGDIEVGEMPGVLRSLAGKVEGEIAFSSTGGRVRGYSGRATIAPAVLVADGVYAGVGKASGPARVEIEFSSDDGGAVAYKGKAEIAGGDVVAQGLARGLDELSAKVDGEVEFEGTPDGTRYRGRAEVVSGRASLGGVVAGLESLSGDLRGSVEFEGLGGEFSYRGVASLTDGALEAGEIARGIERIRGLADAEVSFSGDRASGASYVGRLSVRNASFSGTEVVPGVKSISGDLVASLSFTAGPHGDVSYEGTAEVTHASLAAGEVYPGVKELGANGSARLAFEGGTGRKPRCDAEIVVNKGVVVHEAIASRIEDIEAELGYTADLVEVRGMTATVGGSRFEIAGWLRPGKNVELDITLRSKALALADLGRVSSFAGVAVALDGAGAVDLHLSGFYPRLQYSGEISLAGARVKHPALPLPIEDIRGVISFSGKEMSANDISMTFGGFPIRVSGKVTDPLDPRFELAVSVPRVDVGTLAKIVSPEAAPNASGEGTLHVNLVGTPDHPYADGTIELSTLTVPVGGREASLADVRAAFSYGDGAFAVRDARAGFAGGAVTLSGVGLLGGDGRGIAGARFAIDVKGAQASEVAALVAPDGVRVSGTLDLEGAVTVDAGSYGVEGSCVLSNGAVQGIPIDTARAEFEVADGRVALERLVAAGPAGSLSADGTVSASGEYRLRVAGKDLVLTEFARAVGYAGADVAGKGAFAGVLSGRGAQAELDGLADISAVSIAGRTLDEVVGRVRVSRERVSLDNVGVTMGEASFVVSGEYDLGSDERGVDLAIQLHGVPCSDAASLVGIAELPISGRLAGKVAVTGASGAPQVSGTLALTEGELAGGMRFDGATLGFRFAQGTLAVERLEAQAGSTRLAASGELSKEGVLDLLVAVTGLDLSRLPFAIPGNAVSGGSARFEGRVTGDPRSPSLEGSLEAENVILMSALFPSVKGTLKWRDRTLEFAPLVVGDGTGSATATGSVRLGNEDADLDLSFELSGIGLSTLRRVVNAGRDLAFDGTVSGVATVRGSASRPDVDVKLRAPGMQVAGAVFSEAALDAHASRGEVSLRELRVRQAGGGDLQATGVARPDGALSFSASANRFDAGVLARALGVKYPVTGMVDFTAKVEGTSADPSAVVALTLSGGNVDKVRFDTLTATLAFRNGAIEIQEGRITQGQHTARVSGTIPLSSAQLSAMGIPTPGREEPLDLAIQMEKADLVLLAMFSDEIEWAEGAADVDLRVSGQSGSPRLFGRVDVSGGDVKLASIADSLRDVSAKVSFDGSQATIEEFACRLGDGTVRASGRVVFAGESGPMLDIRVASKGARVQTAAFRALVDSKIALYGPARRPLISGEIALARAEAGLSGWNLGGTLPFDADLALDVKTVGDLRVRTGNIDIPASGAVKIEGTLKQPTVTGAIEARRGWFAYFGNEFTVRRAVAEFRGGPSLMPFVEVEAETSADSTTIYLSLSGTPPDDLSLGLSSSPPRTREEILALLNYPGALARILEGDIEGALKEEIARLFDQELRLQLVGGIERAFEDALALDEFKLERGTSNELTLTIGKYVVDDLYLTYEKGLGPQSPGVLKFEYLYGPGVVLSGRYDERGIYTFGLEARLRF